MVKTSASRNYVAFKRQQVWLFIIGVALMLPLGYITEQELFVLRRSDVVQAIEPIVEIPLDRIPPDRAVLMDAAVPSGKWWNRMVANYAEPKILVAIVNFRIHEDGPGRRVYRLNEVDYDVSISVNGSPVSLEHTFDAPYGYSSDQLSASWAFHASTGQRFTLAATRKAFRAGPPASGAIVIVPDWPRGDIASAFDAFAFLQGIRWIVIATGVLGAGLVLAGLRRRRHSDRP